MASVTKRKRRGTRVARWRARILGRDGRWHERSPPAHLKGLKEVKAWALAEEARERDVREGKALPPATETLQEASVRYLRSIRNARGYRGVESFWRCRILPVLGKVPVGQLKPTQVDELLEQMREGGYSDHTRLRVRSTLSACFEWLSRDNVVATNPVRKSKAPRQPKGNPKVLTYEQVLALAEAASYSGLRHLILLAFFTACRPGELLGATWAEVDLERAELHVLRSMVGADTTKTGLTRVVSLAPAAVALLQEMQATAKGPHLFLNSQGRPMEHRTYAAALKAALVAAGLVERWESVCCVGGCGYVGQGMPEPGARCPQCGGLNLIARGVPIDFSPKGFRSSGITRIVEVTGKVAAAAEQAGHSRTSTTEGHYVKVSKPYVAEAVAQAFAPPVPAAPATPPPAPPSAVSTRARDVAARRWRVETVLAEMKR